VDELWAPIGEAVVNRLCITCTLLIALFGCCIGLAGEDRAARLARFRDRPIHGICGGPRLADAATRGADAVRTYGVPSIAELDRFHALGLRVIVGHWMPHEGKNIGKEGWPWEHSYEKSGATMDREFTAIVERIGGHPAILMWSLGNEVHLEPHYLRQADRLSRILHARHPDVPTSLTMVNAPPESIALVREHTPDIDVIGANVYGAGAITTAITSLHEHWGRPFYFSEFGPTGPWWGPQTSWGERFEQGATAKAADLGGCMFLWGRWPRERFSYFSMLLTDDPWSQAPTDADFRFTPLADEMARLWTGSPPARRAPRIDRLEIDGQTQRDVIVAAGGDLHASAVVADDDRPLRYRWWIARQDERGFRSLAGPVESDGPSATLSAPEERGATLFLLCLALDAADGACATTLPFKTAD